MPLRESLPPTVNFGAIPDKRLAPAARRVHYELARTRGLVDNGRRRCLMGDRGKKDKDKGQKQHAAKGKQEEKRKLDKQPKRNP